MPGDGLRDGLEGLESRVLLSGEVTGRVRNGNLVIEGDGARNRIIVTAKGLETGVVRVAALDDESTKVNGDREAVFTGVTGSVRIVMGGSADTVKVQDLVVAGDLRVEAGRGGDLVEVNRVTVKGHAGVLGRGGGDAIHVLRSVFNGVAEINGDEGNDRIVLDVCTFDERAVVRGGAGDDGFFTETSTFKKGKAVNGQKGEDRFIGAKRVEGDFSAGTAAGWVDGFSDYPVGKEAEWELASGLRTPPAELGWAGKAYMLSGDNHSDDLFMFLKREVTGLRPNGAYVVRFDITFATDAPTGSFGIGGSAGDSVYLKAGATTAEPKRVVNGEKNWRMNIDKSDQARGGRDVSVIGPITHGVPFDQVEEPPKFREVRRTHVHPVEVKADAQGRLWVIAGTDSGFEGVTTVYVKSVSIRVMGV